MRGREGRDRHREAARGAADAYAAVCEAQALEEWGQGFREVREGGIEFRGGQLFTANLEDEVGGVYGGGSCVGRGRGLYTRARAALMSIEAGSVRCCARH